MQMTVPFEISKRLTRDSLTRDWLTLVEEVEDTVCCHAGDEDATLVEKSEAPSFQRLSFAHCLVDISHNNAKISYSVQ